MCNSTTVLPFRIEFQPGISLYEQVVYTATRAVVSGEMRLGDPFPSVRTLSRELRINPNTAHKVIAHLVSQGLLEVRPGVGTVVAAPVLSTQAQRTRLVEGDVEHLVVEAKKLGIQLNQIQEAVTRHWDRLNVPK
jgi:GntR family transcriptional regulator